MPKITLPARLICWETCPFSKPNHPCVKGSGLGDGCAEKLKVQFGSEINPQQESGFLLTKIVKLEPRGRYFDASGWAYDPSPFRLR